MGGLVWQVPDPALPSTSGHYEKLWAAAVELGHPINLHILSGHSYNVEAKRTRYFAGLRQNENFGYGHNTF